MKTSEVEKQLGLTKYTLIYYEKEGLITPVRNENGYRNYSKSDLQTLQLIKFLRNIDISIDDIKAILADELSFSDCLKIRKLNLDNVLEELQTIKKTTSTLIEMQVPLIPALEKIALYPAKKGLGYRKTSKTAAYNRPLTRTMAFQQIITASFFGWCFTFITYMFIYTDNITYLENAFFVLPLFVILTLFFIMVNIKFTMNIYDKSQNQSIEFLEDGIRLYQRLGYIHHFKYIMAAIVNKHDKYQTFYRYEDITKLEVLAKHRYFPIYALGGYNTIGLSTDMYEVDLKFHFNDGNTFFMLGPGTYHHDSQFIGHILRAKVNNIVDKQNILYAYQNKINLTDYLLSNSLMK